MPPEHNPYGSDQLTIPCYLAKGLDDPGFLEWRKDHPDWFIAGTWTWQSSTNEASRAAIDPATSFSANPTKRREQVLAATRIMVGKGRTVPPLDPSTISLADFKEVAAQAKQQRAVAMSSTVAKLEQPGSPLKGGSAAAESQQSPSLSRDADPKLDADGTFHTVAHTNPEGGVPLVLNDGTPVLDRAGRPMLIPPGVDLNRNLRIGQLLSREGGVGRVFDMASLLRVDPRSFCVMT